MEIPGTGPEPEKCKVCGDIITCSSTVAYHPGESGYYCSQRCAEKARDNGWTRCADELPEIGKWVIVYSIKRQRALLYLDGNRKRWEDGGGDWWRLDQVTHWHPLPEPPKE